jgi:hypothetical protein
MLKRTSCMSALAALAVMTMSGLAAASSHREAPAIADDPAADNTDTYAFVQGNNLVIVANYIGLELPEGGPNWAKFSDDVLYEIHIARGGASLKDALTYQIQFKTAKPARKDPAAMPPVAVPAGGIEFFSQLTGSGAFGQTYTVTQLTNGANPTVIAQDAKVPPPNVGPKTNAVAYQIPAGKTYEQFFVDDAATSYVKSLTGGGQVFAGPRDDPFWVDLGAIFDLAQLRPVANPTEANRDSIAYMNVHAIVLEIPLTVANGGTAPTMGTPNTAQTVGVWASASRRKTTILRHTGADEHFGPWVQVSRLGLPLINEAVIGLQDKDYWNRLTPKDDVATFAPYILNPIAVRDAEAVGFYGNGAPLAACTTNAGKDLETARTDIIDVINLTNIPTAGAHNIPLTATGDVLRVDLGLPSGFPNGRKLTDEVTGVELALILCKLKNGGPLPAGPTANETAFKTTFPYLAAPWEGRSANPRPLPSLPCSSRIGRDPRGGELRLPAVRLCSNYFLRGAGFGDSAGIWKTHVFWHLPCAPPSPRSHAPRHSRSDVHASPSAFGAAHLPSAQRRP